MKFAYSHHRKGFSIAEVIIALGILTVAGVGMWLLAAQSLRSVRIARQNLIAANLAQEGIELVRNIRDSNWHAGGKTDSDCTTAFECDPGSPKVWRDKLADDNGSPRSYRAQYDEDGLAAFAGLPLQIDANGFYQYDNGPETPFVREIIISNMPDDPGTPVDESKVAMRVQSIVSWNGRELEVEDILWNWSGQP